MCFSRSGFAPGGGRGSCPGILPVELWGDTPYIMTSPGSGCIACEGVRKIAHGACMFKYSEKVGVMDQRMCAATKKQEERILGSSLTVLISRLSLQTYSPNLGNKERYLSTLTVVLITRRTKTEMVKIVTSPEAGLGAGGGI